MSEDILLPQRRDDDIDQLILLGGTDAELTEIDRSQSLVGPIVEGLNLGARLAPTRLALRVGLKVRHLVFLSRGVLCGDRRRVERNIIDPKENTRGKVSAVEIKSSHKIAWRSHKNEVEDMSARS